MLKKNIIMKMKKKIIMKIKLMKTKTKKKYIKKLN